MLLDSLEELRLCLFRPVSVCAGVVEKVKSPLKLLVRG